jgi:hypothetical protein
VILLSLFRAPQQQTWRKWSSGIFICIAGLFTAIIFFGFLVKPSLQQANRLAPSFVLVAMWAGILWLPTLACFWAHALALKIIDVM